MVCSIYYRIHVTLLVLMIPQTIANWTTILLPDAAKEKGAVCLDGTPGGYHFSPSNSTGWMIHLQGGGWCSDEADCVRRSKGSLGSSNGFKQDMENILAGFDGGAHGLFSSDPTINPRFWNYNKVYARYCDGASFAGNVIKPVKVGDKTIYFRGRRVLDAIISDILERGLSKGTDFIVNGCSAGGLAVYLHLDYIRSLMPNNVIVKGVPECGFFMDLPLASGKPHYTPIYQYVANMQNVSGNVNAACTLAMSETEQWKCFFAQYTLPFIKTPYFIVNSLYDAWQMSNIINPPNQTCPQFETLRTTMIGNITTTLTKKLDSSAYLYDCMTHCAQFCHDSRWQTLKVKSQVLRDAFSNWYDHSKQTLAIDGLGVHSNPTC